MSNRWMLRCVFGAMLACACASAPGEEVITFELPPVHRDVFYRMEKGAGMRLVVKNLSAGALPSVAVTMKAPAVGDVKKELKDIAAGACAEFVFPVPTDRLRPDDYELSLRGETPGHKAVDASFPFTIVKRPNPNRFPVIFAGFIPVQGAKRLADIGFTHVIGAWVSYKYLYQHPEAKFAFSREEYLARWWSAMNEAMKAGMKTSVAINPGHYLKVFPELQRIKRDGTPYEKQAVCPLLPKMQEYCRWATELVMKTYGPHPALDFVDIHNEIRGSAHPCFHKEDIEAYRKATGQEIPANLPGKWGADYTKLKDFPESRIVPDDHPLLTYYRWFWKHGDGWVDLNDMIYDTLKANARKGIWAKYAPVTRVAPVYGGGGHIDTIHQWTYTNPNPVQIGMTADEVINMARGKQRVYQSVQAIWYRSTTAPIKKLGKVEKAGTFDAWDDHDPDAAYITPSPSHMTEGFWAAISRPIQMIGYHGTGSLFPGNKGSYVYTHSDTADALAKVHAKVLCPFGPMLLKIGNRPADVAFLESFASHVFARRATYGWGIRTIGAFWLACEYAGLQSDIIYDETVLEGVLDRYKILVMPDCDVLTQSVYDKVTAFQRKGGLIIADERLVPGIIPDIRLPSIGVSERDGKAHVEAALAAAAQLRKALAGKYEFFAQSEDLQVVLHTRENDGVQYLFAVNDKREFGDYVGPYRMVMENGLPAATTITVRRTGVKVLDLVRGKEVPVETGQHSTRFRAELEPGWGKIFVITDRLPARLKIAAPEIAGRGETVHFDIAVLDADGTPLPSVLPVRVEVLDPAFRPAEPTGDYAAEKGKLRVCFDIAENDRTGVWQVKVTERMTGVEATRYLRIH